MKSKTIYSGIPKKIKVMLEPAFVVVRVVAGIFHIGPSLRAHIFMDRGLGAEVPMYWVKENINDFEASLGMKVHVSRNETI